MGRGVSAGGGQSSLGYLFGGKETSNNNPAAAAAAAAKPIDKQAPAGVNGHLTNNYPRAEGQNCGNFITDRPSTKVHAAPGGGSSLGYLFGGADK